MYVVDWCNRTDCSSRKPNPSPSTPPLTGQPLRVGRLKANYRLKFVFIYAESTNTAAKGAISVTVRVLFGRAPAVDMYWVLFVLSFPAKPFEGVVAVGDTGVGFDSLMMGSLTWWLAS